MNRLTIYELIEFLTWLEPTIKLIKANQMFTEQREEVFQVTQERIELLLEQIKRDYNVDAPQNNPGEVDWLYKLYDLKDERDDDK